MGLKEDRERNRRGGLTLFSGGARLSRESCLTGMNRQLLLQEGAEDIEVAEANRLMDLTENTFESGDITGCKVLIERALLLYEAYYGLEHEKVMEMLCMLAYVCKELETQEESYRYAQRAYSICVKVHGALSLESEKVKEFLDEISSLISASAENEGQEEVQAPAASL